MAHNLAVKVASGLHPGWRADAEAHAFHHELPLQGISAALLGTDSKRPAYLIMGAAVCIYVSAVTLALTIDFNPPPAVLEAPVEMVFDDPAPNEPEQVQPPAPPPPEQQPQPVKEAEAAEPVKQPEPIPEPVKEVPPPPQEQPKPKPRPASRQTPTAIPTNYANQIYQRINRVASGNYPRSALAQHQAARVGYVIVIGQSGELLSKSISSSGNSALDQSVLDTLSRSAPFPAPPNLGARSYKISGAIVYRIE